MEEENQNILNQISEHNEEEEELYLLNQNGNPNFENEPKNKKTDLKNVFLENTESYINEVRNNPDFDPGRTKFTYTFIDDDINERQQASDSDSEINIREPIVLTSQVIYEVNDNRISLIL